MAASAHSEAGPRRDPPSTILGGLSISTRPQPETAGQARAGSGTPYHDIGKWHDVYGVSGTHRRAVRLLVAPDADFGGAHIATRLLGSMPPYLDSRSLTSMSCCIHREGTSG